jgi:hypothetical protein
MGRRGRKKDFEWSDLIKGRYGDIFRLEDIGYLIRRGVISEDFTEGDLEFLDRLARVWRDKELFRRGLMRFTYKERLGIIDVASYKSKLDRFLYERMKNVYLERGKVNFWEILEEVTSILKIELNEQRRKYLLGKMRLIYMDMRRKLGISGIEKNDGEQ